MPKGVAAPDSLLNAESGMNALTLINDLREGLAGAKSQGQTTIPVAVLEHYLDGMESAAASSAALAHAKQRDARAKFEHEMEVWKVRMPLIFQSIIQTGQAALRAAILINGGAVVALLAFVGNVIARGANPGVGIGRAMLIFSSGVLLGAFAAAFTYLCQLFGAEDGREKLAFGFNVAAILSGFVSLIAFGLGGWASFRAMPW